jgi:hypothetical protein
MRLRGLLAIALVGGLLAVTSAQAQKLMPPQSPLYHDISPPLGKIKPIRIETKGPRRENVVHRLTLIGTKGVQNDPVVQRSASNPLPIVAESFEGLGQGLKYDSNVAPPDATGAVGNSYFIEWVNQAFVIFKKKDATVVYGPADGNTLWSGFAPRTNPAHACAETNDGDPIVLYDRIDGRWLLSQFSFSEGRPYLQCVAVSTSSDPLGTYARYAYSFDNFNDYGKFGVWPDGYYASFNMFASSDRNAPGRGAQACAFDRIKMLAGQEAQMICFGLGQTGLLPADLDGRNLPPKGLAAPNYFVSLGVQRLNYWKFHVDWKAPAHSTMIGPDDVGHVPAFVAACTDQTCQVVPQMGSNSLLDTLGDRLMYRLAYRNFGNHEALVVNHAVRVPGPENQNAGVIAFRWYEIRPSGTGLSVHQSGTFRPSGVSRWMASIAMDKAGDMAIGYSSSAPNTYPSAFYTGQVAAASNSPSLGQEYRIQAGEGAQTGERWGDYTTMAVDPADDCTFWFVSEYLTKNNANIWHTRVSRLRFKECL